MIFISEWGVLATWYQSQHVLCMVKKAEMEELVSQVEEMGNRLTKMEELYAKQWKMEIMD